MSLEMPLRLYRRHFRAPGKCLGGHAADTQNYETDELRPKWRKCACPIYASGKLGENPKFRRNTEQLKWEDAKRVAAQWEAEAASASELSTPFIPPPVGEADGRIRLDAAVKAYIAEHEEAGSARATIKKYKEFTTRLLDYAWNKGYVMLDQVLRDDIFALKSSWTRMSPRTRAKRLGYLKSFFAFCIERGWREDNPAQINVRRNRMNKGEGPGVRSQKSPFTDLELQRMLQACERYGQEHPTKYRTWTGTDLADFIALSVYTGLRISDVALFRADRLHDNGDICVRALKNGVEICTWVPDHVQEMIRDRAKKYGNYIFGEHGTDDLDVISDLWRRKLRKVWALCGEWEEAPSPHRFRHTFVRILLQKGVPVGTVAELIGDTEDMVRRHYAKWVPERQAHVRALLKEAFADAPKQLVRVK